MTAPDGGSKPLPGIQVGEDWKGSAPGGRDKRAQTDTPLRKENCRHTGGSDPSLGVAP